MHLLHYKWNWDLLPLPIYQFALGASSNNYANPLSLIKKERPQYQSISDTTAVLWLFNIQSTLYFLRLYLANSKLIDWFLLISFVTFVIITTLIFLTTSANIWNFYYYYKLYPILLTLPDYKILLFKYYLNLESFILCISKIL